MYILKNSIISLLRNKGRNILIGIIILVISAACTVTLAIRNTANTLVKNYQDSTELVASISFNGKLVSNNFKGGQDAIKQNIESFNNIAKLSVSEIEEYGKSDYLEKFYYEYSTSLNSDTLTKASDKFEYEVENKETSTNSSTSVSGNSSRRNRFPDENGEPMSYHTNTNTTTVITKSKEIFQSSRNLTGDFKLNGYSSYDSMTDFIEGNYVVKSGEIFQNFDSFDCLINEELASLNNISVGNKITLKNPTTQVTYDFTVTGIYEDNSKTNNTSNMFSSSANSIITGSKVVEKLVTDDSTLNTNLTPSFVLKNKDVIEPFMNEIKNKGLNENYIINTNLDKIENATKSIENVETFATTFLIIALSIAVVVLLVINMINIRERKYEIGVYRTIGISKFKLCMQFILELLVVTIIALSIGACIGGVMSKTVGNNLLKSEIEKSESSQQQISDNFGRPDMNHGFNKTVQVETINSINAVVDYVVVLELLGIGIGLTLVSSLVSMISIQKFSPLTILKERS